jgi:hypothetical protein
MPKSDKEHIHKFCKHKYDTGVEIYFCTLNCNYKIEVPFALGKEVLCNICTEPFTMTKKDLKLKEPHCLNCGRKEVKDEDGKKHYVRRVSSRVLTSIAIDTTSALSSRLREITGNADEGDI